MQDQETKILVCADVHGEVDLLGEAVQGEDNLSLVLIAGDMGAPEEDILDAVDGIPCIMVMGNNDDYLYDDLPDSVTFDAGGKHFFMTHGHLYGVDDRTNLNPLLEKAAKDAGADIVVYGHSHHYEADKKDGVLYLNPGAVVGDPDAMAATCAYLTLHTDGSVDVRRRVLVDLNDWLNTI